ncbi:hypothetical protein PMI29_01585 [Pseudomonas sp. GM49]|uniref:hypothetical protein n=1 Tax=Pseudomonas sp. GM49 TaxID=1144331 RepID=UPI000270A961|nr:hypothetical protein [Pseudomonas sp. GM49]EJM70424.1 hypothetical protein PMI29_01585 [Pseudomonas sp. GM49]
MTVLILSLWALGILLLIGVAVYRGRNTAPALSAKIGEPAVAASALKVHVQSAARVVRDTKGGKWKVIRDRSPEREQHYGALVASAGKPHKPGSKTGFVRFRKPGKSPH